MYVLCTHTLNAVRLENGTQFSLSSLVTFYYAALLPFLAFHAYHTLPSLPLRLELGSIINTDHGLHESSRPTPEKEDRRPARKSPIPCSSRGTPSAGCSSHGAIHTLLFSVP